MLVDISKPLCRGRRITLEDGKAHWVSFKYEHLPNLCYWCECLTHDDRDYETWIDSEGSLKPEEQQFGSWIRAPPFIASRKKVISVPGFFAKKKQSNSTHFNETQPSIPPMREHQLPPKTTPHPLMVAKEIIENQETEVTNEAVFAHQESFERSKEDSTLKYSNLGDFEKVILDIDSEIHYFDKMEASPLGPKIALPMTEQANPSHPAHPPGPICEFFQLSRQSPLLSVTSQTWAWTSGMTKPSPKANG